MPAAQLVVPLGNPLLAPDALVITTPPPVDVAAGASYEFLLGHTGAEVVRFQNALAELSPFATGQFQTTDLDALRIFRIHSGIIRAGTAAGLILSLLAFLIALADRARERRRNIAALVAIGVPRRAIRLSQMIELALPAALALTGAVVVGVLVGTAYLCLGGALQHGFYLGTLTATLPLVLVAAAGVIASGAVLGGRRIDPTLLRRE